MSSTIISEQREGTVTVSLRMSLQDAGMLLDIVTDSVLNGFTRGKAQEWGEQLMHDLDGHIEQGERYIENCGKTFPRVHRCGDCGYFYQQQDCDSLCPNCKEK